MPVFLEINDAVLSDQWLTLSALGFHVLVICSNCSYKMHRFEKSSMQGGHSPGKPGIIREFMSGQGKVRENVFLHVAIYHG